MVRQQSEFKDMVVTNLKRTDSDVSMPNPRFLTDGSFDGALPKPLLQHCGNAKMRYVRYFDENKKKKKENDKQREELRSEIKKVSAKRRQIITSIEAMRAEADAVAEKAERKQDFTMLTRSNAYRKSVAQHICLDAVWSDNTNHLQRCCV